MYKIIGADGREYGPVSAEMLKQWIADNRVSGQTKVLPEGTTEWKPLAEIPELAALLPAAGPPPLGGLPVQPSAATDLVSGPGIGLVVTGALNVVFGFLRILMSVTGLGMSWLGNAGGQNDEMAKIIASAAGTMGIALGALGAICGAITLMGGLKLRKLESFGLCVTACILAIIPCTSPCCFVGLPIGIWALVVLFKPEVKSQFH